MIINQNGSFSAYLVIFVIVHYLNTECLGFHLLEPNPLYFSENVTRVKRQFACNKSQFQCDNGQCIPNHRFCDGQADCSDASDEYLNCNTQPCSPFAFRCAYGACVDGDAKCNGVKECHDNSDENNDDCTNSQTDDNNNCGRQFHCNSGQCIDQYLVCDGEANCPDESDEKFEICNLIKCQSYSFRCAYGACIDGDAKCNGHKDCADGSDESPRICRNNTNIVTTTIRPPRSCPPLRQMENGIYTVSGVGYVPGSQIPSSAIVNFQCNANYKLSPNNNLIRCLDGVWDLPIPRCLPFNAITTPPSSVDCAPPIIENGLYTKLRPDNIEEAFSTIYFFKCNTGFKLHPPVQTVQCVNGRFNTPLPKCLQTCEPRVSSTVVVECELDGIKQDCTKPVVENTLASMSCPNHYQSATIGFNTAICTGGSWNSPLITCHPACGEPIGKGGVQIINGTDAELGDFPWHVAIYRQTDVNSNPNFICGGSIISEKVIVSAAHCFSFGTYQQIYPANQFRTVAGKFYSDWEIPLENEDFIQRRLVTKIEIPTTYRGILNNYEADIAVLVVDKSFVYSEIIKPVCIDWESLYDSQQLKHGNNGHVVGWGFLDPSIKEPSVTLKHLEAPFIDSGQCQDSVPKDFIKYVTSDKFCAGYLNGSSTCKGDSGGGFVFSLTNNRRDIYFLRGIVSSGPLKDGECDKHSYGVYTRISSYLPYMRKIVAYNRVSS